MNIKRSAWLVAAFAMLTVCVYGAFAPEELVVAGLYDTITKYVAEDDVDVIPANVLIDSGGALNKTGGGLLTLPLEKLVQGKEITIGVRDGAMRVTAFDAETVGFLGGHAARGLISSETHPQYSEGVGEIYVKPRGAVFSLR